MPHENSAADLPLKSFELPAFLVKPAVMACRSFNSAVDAVFYDVPTFRAELKEAMPLDAVSDPEGCLLLVDAAKAPHVVKFAGVPEFFASESPEAQAVAAITITGVGSSALGSAAMAWDVSKALGEPALAIVPGYGVADVILQALGGWFGYGMHDFFGAKSAVQATLAQVAPESAKIGRRLAATAPGARTVNGAPVFRTGSGSSDALHALIGERPGRFRLLIGHSKGALQIANALRSLDAAHTDGLHVVTLGCPIGKDAPGVTYHQYLGLFDALGQINMWGHLPDKWPPTWHSTNPFLPPAMPVGKFAQEPN